MVRLQVRGRGVMEIVALTGLSYPAVRKAIDLFVEGGWATIKPAARGRSAGDGRRLSVKHEASVGAPFELAITDQTFDFQRRQAAISAEAALDGICIIRTSVHPHRMTAADCVRNYKALANVERAFRSLKTVDLKVRPIHHRTADRVRAHILLYMLAYYVEWHMREAWRELMFADTDQAAKATRDPVAPATRSKAALAKVASHQLDDATPAHSFATLMADLSTIVRNTCRAHDKSEATFDILTTPSAKQRRALERIQQIRV